jgi:hypothetical protein
MLKPKVGQVAAGATPNYSNDSIRIEAGSVVVDNSWINYDAILFRLTDHIASVVRPPRSRFFQNRNYAVYLLVGLDINEGIRVAEGRQVPFTTVMSVPRPQNYDFIPLVGVVVIQDGSSDLNNGYLPLSDDCLEFFNGSGNVVDAGFKGITGVDCDVAGQTGAEGYTGLEGMQGETGLPGIRGYTGVQPPAPAGDTGVQGMTGINWQVHVPLEEFFYS